MTSNDLFTKAAAGKYVGVSRQAVEQRIEKGKLPLEPSIHGQDLIRREHLDAWKKERSERAQRLVQATQG